jgi:hypothetical protein
MEDEEVTTGEFDGNKWPWIRAPELQAGPLASRAKRHIPHFDLMNHQVSENKSGIGHLAFFARSLPSVFGLVLRGLKSLSGGRTRLIMNSLGKMAAKFLAINMRLELRNHS